MEITIHGKVYNLKNYKHPGGNEILKLCENENDCTALFESYHAFSDMKKIKMTMKKYEKRDSHTKNEFSFKPDGFYYTCKKRVNKLFTNKKSIKANIEWYKTVLCSIFLFIMFQFFVLFFQTGIIKCIMSIGSGITLVSIGYNILHDGSHYGISQYVFINNILSRIIQGMCLWNHTLWSYHHCIRHHQYTGDIEKDPDMINSRPFLRKSKQIRPRKSEFTKILLSFKTVLFNTIYPGTALGQTIMYHVYWINYRKLWKMDLPKHFGGLWDIFQYIISFCFVIFELCYGGLLYFYLHLVGMNIGYFIGSAPDHDMYPNHLQIEEHNKEQSEQSEQSEQYIIKDWGEIQVKHSGNFMSNYPLFTRFYGGINYQIEHHLFPTLNNHKLVEISSIVKECCKEFNIPYVCIDNPIDVFKQVCKSYYDVHSNKLHMRNH
uniref:Cytochrome b5 heme-binding domain-containing protein n=1 Tax=viral metagenome TaxID=1070528 RepID=A0A6C0KGR0_9ZZZZ